MCKFAPWATKGLVEVSKESNDLRDFFEHFGEKKIVINLDVFF